MQRGRRAGVDGEVQITAARLHEVCKILTRAGILPELDSNASVNFTGRHTSLRESGKGYDPAT